MADKSNYCRQVMPASMIATRGPVQKQGEVIHVICDRFTDHDDMLRPIGRPNSRSRRAGVTAPRTVAVPIRVIPASRAPNARLAAVPHYD